MNARKPYTDAELLQIINAPLTARAELAQKLGRTERAINLLQRSAHGAFDCGRDNKIHQRIRKLVGQVTAFKA